MKTYFRDNKSDNLIVFFCGWAMDERAFDCTASEDYDVLFVYDYSDLRFEFDFCSSYFRDNENGESFTKGEQNAGGDEPQTFCDTRLNLKYKSKTLITFSYGVFMASLCKGFENFDSKIAVNGTLKPIDKDFGINPKIFDLTLANISEESMAKFYSKMFDNNLDLEYFLEHLPERSVSEFEKELANIKKCAEHDRKQPFDYDKIIISNSDKIIPTKSQHNYWAGSQVRNVEAGHFLFYKFNDFGEIISL